MNCSSRSRFALWRKSALGLVVVILILFAVACAKQRQPGRYLIPDGYVGWAVIEFNVDAARPREEDGHLVFQMPPSGWLEIPGEPKYGLAQDEYYYVDEKGVPLKELPITPPGGGGLIWGGRIGTYSEEGMPMLTYEFFFVGPEEAFERAPKIDELLRSRAAGEPAPPPR